LNYKSFTSSPCGIKKRRLKRSNKLCLQYLKKEKTHQYQK
jgi:hypothetical protein